jgi:hypothetical protein
MRGKIYGNMRFAVLSMSNNGIVFPAEEYEEIDRTVSEFPFSPGKRFVL